jgi:phosphatidylserine decarboxylase
MKTKKGMRSTFQNEYNSMLFSTPEWHQFRVIQIAGFFARRIVPYLKLQDEVIQWQWIGHIKFWSQVSVILDDNFEVVAKVWDKVIDWETIIAKKK